MQWIPEYQGEVKRVERFNFVARMTHWGHTVTFLLCLLTGLILFCDGLDFLSHVFGGYYIAGLIHRIAAVFMTLFIGVFIIFDFKGIVNWVKDILRFGKNDIIFVMKFPLEFLGFEVKIPPQTRFNGGEKGNSIVTPTCVILLVLSGYIMWFPFLFSPGLVRVAYPTHDIAMILATCMVCMHGYLGSFHPGSGESFWGMWKGTVRADWAMHHHHTWYEETYGEKAEEAE
ncbi:MAG TPA: cytochrome b/b6 domain-containing protein [Syntrophomonadaceae bacterium]|nr:cytochrome b/b6 domain-containing protein [Syntrophomonadaceae bacterium]